MSDINWRELSDQISRWGKELGFDDVGITDIDLSGAQAHLEQWLNNNYQGEMGYMAKHGSLRSHPETLHPGTISVISVRLNYLEKEPAPIILLDQRMTAYVSRYALGRDYHKVIRAKLKRLARHIEDYLLDNDYPGFKARVFTDSAPLLEKALAEKSGLGWIGKNTLLLNEKSGSWFFLGEILTNLPLPAHTRPQTNRCGSCSACIDVCPTDAFVAPYQLDARRCISYLTIEHKGSIPEELRAPMGNRVFGCDDCQLVCPWNRYAKSNAEDDFKPRHGLEDANLIELFNWREEEFLEKTAGSAIRRTGFDGWQRNLAIGLGNAPYQPAIIKTLNEHKPLATDLVNEHITWALAEQATKRDE